MESRRGLQIEPLSPPKLPVTPLENSEVGLQADVPKSQLPVQVVLRDGLLLHEEDSHSGSPRSILEDTVQRKFYRLGLAESRFIHSLLSNPLVSRALQQQIQDQSLSLEQAGQLCQWLAKNGLTASGNGKSAPQTVKLGLSKLYFFRLPLFNPDRFLEFLNRCMGWAFSWQATLLGLTVACLGIMLALGNGKEFLDSYQNLFTPWRGACLLAAWIVLKAVHEIAHGVTCKRYGGSIPEAGLAFVVLMPIAYVDVTSCWRFRSRWQRLHVTLAGVTAELCIAGLAMFVWTFCQSLPIKNAVADVVLLASVASVLFNLNPLLKFDGYFALVDISGVDNLYQYGHAYARYFCGRYVLGLDLTPPNLPTKNPSWIKFYGLAAAFWRVMTIGALLCAAATLFAGAGIALAFVGVVTFGLFPLIQLMKYLRRLHASGDLLISKLLLRVSLLGGALVGALLVAPAELSRTSPGIVEYDPPSIVRAPVAGFVVEIMVNDGDWVDPGQPLLIMQNEELELERAELQKKLAQALQYERSARWTNDSSKLEEAEAESKGLQQQLDEVELHVAELTIRAPVPGRVVARQWNTLVGTFLEQGEEIGAIGDERSKRLKISLSSWEASRVEVWKSSTLMISIIGHASWKARLSHLESRASTVPPDASLTATGGGSLPVMENDKDELVLCDPRLCAYIDMDAERSQEVFSGQRCYVRVQCPRESLGAALWHKTCDLMRHFM